VRSQRRSVFTSGLFSNPWLWVAVITSVLLHVVVIYWPPLQAAFDTVPLSLFDWMVATAVASSVLIVMELVKLGIPDRRQ
jgi:P-type Ca2+ transporter type 2C